MNQIQTKLLCGSFRHTWCDHTKMIIHCHYGSQATHAFLGMLPLYYIRRNHTSCVAPQLIFHWFKEWLFRWMEVYPPKWWCVLKKIATVITYHLILNALKLPKIQFDVNVSNGVAIDVANDVLPVWWMEVYTLRLNQSKSLLHAAIKWYTEHGYVK